MCVPSENKRTATRSLRVQAARPDHAGVCRGMDARFSNFACYFLKLKISIQSAGVPQTSRVLYGVYFQYRCTLVMFGASNKCCKNKLRLSQS